MTAAPRNDKPSDDVSVLQARIVELENELHTRPVIAQASSSQDLLTDYAELMHLYDVAPIGLALIDTDLRFLRINEKLATINGVSPQEHIGRSVREVIPALADTLEPLIHKILRTGNPLLNMEITGSTQDVSNEPGEFLVSYIPIKNDADEVYGICCIVQDVAAIKYAGIDLRASEARHRAILAASLDPMVVINQFGTIQSTSHSLEGVFGWSEKDVIGKNISMLMPYPFQLEHDGYLETYRNTGRTWILGVTRELRAVHKDGTTFPCEVSVSRVDTPGRHELLFAGIIRDISERVDAEKLHRDMESQLRQSQKMEAIGAMAGGIAHDFSNLLTAIQGYSSLLRTAIGEEPEITASLEGIEKAASQASSLTESLLTFSRKSSSSMLPSSVAEILCDTMKIVRLAFPASVEVKVDTPENDECWIKADSTQIQQVFMNLVINARDSMPDGGSLGIACGLCQGVPIGFKAASNFQHATNVFIEFVDSGIGMSEDVRQRIFEPFFTTKPRGQGTGLGMSVVYGIVCEHGGLIEISSKESFGTTVRLLFPSCSQPTTGHDIQSPKATRDGSGETILIIESNQQVRAVLSTAMANKGYRVIQAASGVEAARVFHDYQDVIDLVILDTELPKRSGLSCLEEFRKHRPLLSAIIMTGKATFDVAALNGSNVELLQKPFRVDLLIELIQKQL